jgi:hypothetical protein
MSLEIVSFTLGPVQTNAYLIADGETGAAAVIDPSWDGDLILAEAQRRGWRIAHLVHPRPLRPSAARRLLTPQPAAHRRPAPRHDLWKAGGGGPMFGFNIDPGPEPYRLHPGPDPSWAATCSKCATPWPHARACRALLRRGRRLLLRRPDLFPWSAAPTVWRSWPQLVESIRAQIYSLPGETRLLSGHGPETTVAEEKASNPFVQGI